MTVTLFEVEMVRLVGSQRYGLGNVVERQGKSLEQITLEYQERIMLEKSALENQTLRHRCEYPRSGYLLRLETFKVLRNSVSHQGQTLVVESEPYDVAHHFFSDVVKTREEAEREENKYLLQQMDVEKCSQLVQAGASSIMDPFRPERGDTLLKLRWDHMSKVWVPVE